MLRPLFARGAAIADVIVWRTGSPAPAPTGFWTGDRLAGCWGRACAAKYAWNRRL